MAEAKTGKVYLIGAGPGDPGLLTVKALEVLRRADVVITAPLVSPVLLRETKPGAEIISESKDPNLLVQLAQAGKLVARLYSDDPFVMCNGAGAAEVLQAAGVTFEIVPGVTSAIAAPAYAAIPVTYRDLAQAFSVIGDIGGLNWAALAQNDSTLSFLLPVEQFELVARNLIEAGKSADTPVAVIQNGTTWRQTTLICRLADISRIIGEFGTASPAVMVVGPVVKLRERLRWWDTPEARPLLGKRVVVTRAREQAASFVAKLIELGADAIEFPTIKIIEPESYAPMDAAIGRLESYDWVVFTSVNGVDYFMRRLKLAGRDARAFGKAKVCAIGPATAAALEANNVRADFVPSQYVAESILEELGEVAGKRILLARADVAREALMEGLTQQGAIVENVIAYRQTIGGEDGPATTSAADLVQLLEAGEIDLVTFTSSNTVRNFGKRLAEVSSKPLPELLENTLVACIGPITAGSARELGLRVDLEAAEFTIDKLIETMLKAYRTEKAGAI